MKDIEEYGLLKIDEGFKADTFKKFGLEGSIIIDPDYKIYDDIDFVGWENGMLCLKGDREPSEIRLPAEQLQKSIKTLS